MTRYGIFTSTGEVVEITSFGFTTYVIITRDGPRIVSKTLVIGEPLS